MTDFVGPGPLLVLSFEIVGDNILIIMIKKRYSKTCLAINLVLDTVELMFPASLMDHVQYTL